MGDRAPATVIIYEVPAAIVDDYGDERTRAEQIIDLLNGCGFRHEGYLPCHVDQLDEQHLPAIYEDDQAGGMITYLGGGSDIDELVEWGVTFSVHQSAYYEWDGRLSIHVPSLGIFDTACNQDGGAVVDVAALDEMVAKCAADDELTAGALIAALDVLTGRLYREALGQVEAAHAARREQVGS